MASNNNTPRSSSNNYSSFSSVPSSLAHFFSGSRLARGSSGSTSGSGQSGPGLASLAASPSAYPRSYADQVAEVGGALGGATIGHVQAGLQAALVGRPINRAVGPSGESVSMNATFLSETSRELGGAAEFLKKIGVRFDADGNIDQASLAAGLRDYMASEKVREDAFLSHWGDG